MVSWVLAQSPKTQHVLPLYLRIFGRHVKICLGRRDNYIVHRSFCMCPAWKWHSRKLLQPKEILFSMSPCVEPWPGLTYAGAEFGPLDDCLRSVTNLAYPRASQNLKPAFYGTNCRVQDFSTSNSVIAIGNLQKLW